MGKNSIILLAMLVILAGASNINPNYDYQDFYRQFNRTYQGEEKELHRKIFDINYAQLLESNEKNGTDWVVNQMLDWTEQQYRGNFILILDFLTYNPQNFQMPLSSPARRLKTSGLFTAPSKFDWRDFDKVTSVKDQGGCGSCWAFAATAQYQSLWAINSPTGEKLDLSEQFALECSFGSLKCGGGIPLQALFLFSRSGAPLEEQYPYKARSTFYSSQNISICQETNTKNLTNVRNIGHYFKILTQEQIKQFLVTVGPISVGVNASEPGFRNVGPSGSIFCQASPHINHAVLLVGYNQTHWFIKNSWDQTWADDGFAYIDRSGDCNILYQVNVMEINYATPPVPLPDPITPTPFDGPIPDTVNLTFFLTDSAGDGWEGTVLGLIQNKALVGTLGQTFTSGKIFGNVTITVKSQQFVQIVVTQLGSWSREVGFIMYSYDGTPLFQRINGTFFNSSIIFYQFCPTQNCVIPETVTYYVTVRDSYGDGWNGNILSLKQRDDRSTQTFTLTSGRGGNIIPLTLLRRVNVDIIVWKFGTWTKQIGFQIRTATGQLVFERKSGAAFAANDILGSFCPECLNLNPVNILPLANQNKYGVVTPKDVPIQQQISQSSDNSYKIATFVLAPLLLVALIVAGLAMVKAVKLSKQTQAYGKDNIESAKDIYSEKNMVKM